MVRIEKTGTLTCKGCMNDGHPSSVCHLFNELFDSSCVDGRHIYIEEGKENFLEEAETQKINLKEIR